MQYKTGEVQKGIELMEHASQDPILATVPDIKKLFADNIELMKTGKMPTALWRVAR